MRFLIGKSIYVVEVVGAETDFDRLSWVDGNKLSVLREQSVESAGGALVDAMVSAWVIERGGITSEEPRSLIDMLGEDRAADLIEGFERQLQNVGGLESLAKMMGLVSDAQRPSIEWGKLTPAEAREASLRWHHAAALTDEQFVEYRQQFTARGLNPLAGDCYPRLQFDRELKRHTVKLIATLDGLRRIAARTGLYAGCTSTEWCGEDGVWKNVWTGPGYPYAARVGVYRKDCVEPIYAVAEFDAYAQTVETRDGTVLTKFWKRMPTFMIGKCAMSLALSAAFIECAGLYVREELATSTPRTSDGGTHGRQLQRVEGTVCTLDGDEGAIDAGDVAPQGFMAQIRRAMIQAGCPGDAVESVIDQVRASTGTLDDDNPELFAQRCVDEVRKRYRRRR